jgi:hypothetical protein
MKRMMVAGLCGLLLTTSLVRADEAPPRPQPKPGKFVVFVDGRVKTPQLTVPRQMLNDQRRGDAGILHTVMAGMALALAFAGGGLWLVRQRQGGNGAALAVLVCLSALSIGTALWADSAGPPPARATFDGVHVFVVDKGDSVQLTISPADLAKLDPKGLRGGN